VSSLRHDDLGRLERIQFDATVSPGNSGGPVILADGLVYAVANIAIGTSRINFGVPAGRLLQLLAECPLDKKIGEKCRLQIAGEPSGAEAFVDGRLVGTTPLSTSVDAGRHYVQLRAAGRRTWSRMLTVYDEQKIEARLEPAQRLALRIVPQPPALAGGGPALKRGASLYAQDFSRPQTILDWDQDTGGSETRTWYAEDGMLHQWQDDGMLHAVFTGSLQWRDYAFSARVKIQPNERDGRAGLIFRATEDGFALFRLHRQTSKVQLAYHMKDPFGWQVLAERKLPFEVEADHWYEMQVQAAGDRLLCLIDGAPVVEASLPQARHGRVGFYSVDSRASFDDALVTAVVAPERPAAPSAPLQSFWFTESFQKQPTAWQACADWKPAAPWLVAEGACLQLEPQGRRMNLLECYDICDGSVSAVCTGTGGAIGLVFRRSEQRCCVFEVSLGENQARLLALDGDKRTVLAATDDKKRVERALALGALMPESNTPGEEKKAPRPRTSLFVLNVIFQGKSIRAGVNTDILLETSDETLTHGSVGLYTDGTRAAFLEIRAAAPVEGP
ncbi:MAG: PEGA domain-containing protein, partial [Planctomycetota bacterium]|nr:PEGA domain-containing protein [Planctomycetota bacterium]